MHMYGNLEYYKVFYHVAEYQNITQAAKELYMTQPAVTRTIHNLEAQLECQLFIRNSRGVRLTAEGEMFYRKLIPVFESIEEVEKEFEQMRMMEAGVIRIGASNIIAEYILSNYTDGFQKRYPNIEFKISRIPISEITDYLIMSRGDMVFTMSAPQSIVSRELDDKILGEKNVIDQHIIGTFRNIFLVGPKYSYMSEYLTEIGELSSLPLILPNHISSVVWETLKVLRRNMEVDEKDFLIEDANTRLLLTKRNFGMMYFPEIFVVEELKRKELFKVNTELTIHNSQFSVISGKGRMLSAAAKNFMEYLITSKVISK